MKEKLILSKRFNGPPDSANGGYVCGLLAKRIDGIAEITLRSPPPLERELTLFRDELGTLLLMDGDSVLGEGRESNLQIEPPPPPRMAAAELAAKHYPGFETHAFPTCFACGPEREEGDGLRIFSGPVHGSKMVAAPWTPHASLAEASGKVGSEYLWAALDCPSGWAVVLQNMDAIQNGAYILLGRLTADIHGSIEPGQRTIACGWFDVTEGRKHFAVSAIYTEEGSLVASALATWIMVHPPA